MQIKQKSKQINQSLPFSIGKLFGFDEWLAISFCVSNVLSVYLYVCD